jgi:erythromycin esterase-like protein
MSKLVDWVRKAGVILPPVGDWNANTAARLAIFDPLLVDRNAVFLGEMDHFVHEKTDFRLLLVRYLVSRGWTRMAEEMSWSDGVRVGRYLAAGGDDVWLERLAGLGYGQDLRPDRLDRPTGVLKASFDLYPVELFRAEQLRFYRSLRVLGANLEFYGFDVDALPGGAYADIADHLRGHAADPAVQAWLTDLARVPGESVAAEAARLRRSLAQWEARALGVDAPTMRRVGLSLQALIETLDYIGLTYHQSDYAALSPGLARREEILKRQAMAALEDAGRKPTVFLAHALHLLKDDRLGGSAGPAGPGGGRTPSVGHFLATERGLRVFSVWMIWGGGQDSQPFPDLPTTFAYGRDTLNAALGAIRQPVIFPVAGAPGGLFDRPWLVAHMYNATAEARLEGQVDAILYLPTVGPMRAPPE